MEYPEVWVLVHGDVDLALPGRWGNWPLLFSSRDAAIGWLAAAAFWPIAWMTATDGRERGRDPSGRRWVLYQDNVDGADDIDAYQIVHGLEPDAPDEVA
jgi:hypothetical protein